MDKGEEEGIEKKKKERKWKVKYEVAESSV